MSLVCECKELLLGITELLVGIAILCCTFTMLEEAGALYYGASYIGTHAVVNSLLLININVNPYFIVYYGYGVCIGIICIASGFIATIVTAVFLVFNGLAIGQRGATDSAYIIMIVLLIVTFIQSIVQVVMLRNWTLATYDLFKEDEWYRVRDAIRARHDADNVTVISDAARTETTTVDIIGLTASKADMRTKNRN